MAQDLWAEAVSQLKKEDRQECEAAAGGVDSINMLGTLKQICAETENEKQRCLDRGWAVYKSGDKEIKLRHVLEKISVWVNEFIPIVDQAVKFDASGNAAMPWAVIKLLVTGVTSNITVFTSIGDGIEFVTRLIVRYCIIERLYLGQGLEVTAELADAITRLYAAVLVYLAAAKRYFQGKLASKIARGLLDTMMKRYEALQRDMSETDVEKLLRVADAEFRQRMEANEDGHYKDLQSRLERLDQPIMSMAVDISQIRDQLQREERRKVFQWMSTIPYRLHHENNAKGLVPGSGTWLLKSHEFIDWTQSNNSSIFWLVGMMGSGKTSLVANVIDSLRNNNLTSEPCPTAFFYCYRDTAEPERAMPGPILSAVVKQLASTDPDEPVRLPIAEEYTKRKKAAEVDCSEPQRLDVGDCTRLLLELTNSNPAFIILDALDECHDDYLHELLGALDKVLSLSREIVKIFVSSRENVDITQFTSQPKYAITETRITPEKNGRDIESFIETEVQRLHDNKILLKGQLKRDSRKVIVKKLKAGSNGMFQWVAMSLETIKSCKTTKDLKTMLGSLPQKLSVLYDGIYEEIVVPESYAGKVAIMTFTLLLYAPRLMSQKELLDAVSRHLDEEEAASNGWDLGADWSSDSASESASDWGHDSDLDSHRLSNIGDSAVTMSQLLEICRNLVVFDNEENVFRFPHLSVREYLLSRTEYTPLPAHLRILARCVDGLIYDLRAHDRIHQDWATQVVTDESQCAFLDEYAVLYWIYHYSEAGGHPALDDNIRIQLDKFLFLDDSAKPSWIYALWCSQVDWPLHYSSVDARGLVRRFPYTHHDSLHMLETPIKLACTLGLLGLLGAAADRQGFDVNDPSEIRALQLAASNGKFEIVKLLIELGADPDSREDNFYGQTSLACAIRNNHEEIARYLLDTCNADPNIENGYGNTSLHLAAASSSRGNVAIALSLLAREDVQPDTENLHGETPLFCAFKSMNCSPALIAALLDRGVDINSKDINGRSVLHAAMWPDSGPNQQATEEQAGRRIEAVRLLLAQKAINVNSQDLEGNSPLQLALWLPAQVKLGTIGAYQIVELLLARKDILADVNNRQGKTSLMMAAESGNAPIVRMLLSRDDVDANARDGGLGRTPLLWALSYGPDTSGAVVRILVESGKANITARDSKGSTAVTLAAESRNMKALSLLIAEGLSASLADNRGQTPLLRLCSTNRWFPGYSPTIDIEIIKLLLSADELGITARDFQGRTALSWAAEESRLDIVKVLVAEGADTSLADYDGVPPLLYASKAGKDDIAEFLLSVGHSSLAARDLTGRTALSWAAERSTLDFVKLLAAEGGDTSLADYNGVPPLLYASRAGNADVVEYLLSVNHGAVAARDSRGRTALSWAVEKLPLDVVKLLIANGADMSLADEEGIPPLFYACSRRIDTEDLEPLLSLDGADLATRDLQGRTALAWTVEKGQWVFDRVKLLVAKGADVSVVDNAGHTPLDIVRGNRCGSRQQVLLKMDRLGLDDRRLEQFMRQERQGLIDFLSSQMAQLNADN
ncbi:ankyrin repeat-containing domain protein [Cladorrhinum samala]|uniref:Ankyrin repeat-containing domain protein n=1 Tax=Cladorrhinum samala TaxID=585594 RepID=A0AAV9HQJ0_9PEZI|nr:ankyrin repeat-containing domain protein [Cladorrhinum samala]